MDKVEQNSIRINQGSGLVGSQESPSETSKIHKDKLAETSISAAKAICEMFEEQGLKDYSDALIMVLPDQIQRGLIPVSYTDDISRLFFFEDKDVPFFRFLKDWADQREDEARARDITLHQSMRIWAHTVFDRTRENPAEKAVDETRYAIVPNLDGPSVFEKYQSLSILNDALIETSITIPPAPVYEYEIVELINARQNANRVDANRPAVSELTQSDASELIIAEQPVVSPVEDQEQAPGLVWENPTKPGEISKPEAVIKTVGVYADKFIEIEKPDYAFHLRPVLTYLLGAGVEGFEVTFDLSNPYSPYGDLMDNWHDMIRDDYVIEHGISYEEAIIMWADDTFDYVSELCGDRFSRPEQDGLESDNSKSEPKSPFSQPSNTPNPVRIPAAEEPVTNDTSSKQPRDLR